MQTPIVSQSVLPECPKCGKATIVTPQSGVYHCLSCDFERDLSFETEQTDERPVGEIVFACIGCLLTFALIL